MERPPRPPRGPRAPARPAGRPAPAAQIPTRPAPSQHAQARRILAPFLKKGPDGKPKYSKAERRRVYQLMLVTLIPPARFAELPPVLQALAGELAVSAGVAKGASAKDATAKLQAYFAKNAPPPELMADLNAAMRAIVRELEAAAKPSTTEPLDPHGLAAPRAPAAAASKGVKGLFGMIDVAALRRR